MHNLFRRREFLAAPGETLRYPHLTAYYDLAAPYPAPAASSDASAWRRSAREGRDRRQEAHHPPDEESDRRPRSLRTLFRGDRRGSALELVAEVGSTSRKMLNDSVGKCQEVDGCPVDVKSLVIKGRHGYPFGNGNGYGYGYGYEGVILAAMGVRSHRSLLSQPKPRGIRSSLTSHPGRRNLSPSTGLPARLPIRIGGKNALCVRVASRASFMSRRGEDESAGELYVRARSGDAAA